MSTRKSYHLYIWKRTGRLVWDAHAGRLCALQPRHRGKRIASFRLYKELVADAQQRTIAAGYPKSRWMDLFDWNQS
jgi:hypothetical protein